MPDERKIFKKNFINSITNTLIFCDDCRGQTERAVLNVETKEVFCEKCVKEKTLKPGMNINMSTSNNK
jgi:hypothetical protein